MEFQRFGGLNTYLCICVLLLSVYMGVYVSGIYICEMIGMEYIGSDAAETQSRVQFNIRHGFLTPLYITLKVCRHVNIMFEPVMCVCVCAGVPINYVTDGYFFESYRGSHEGREM